MKEFSFRYKSLIGVEGRVDLEALQVTARVILLGMTVAPISFGLTRETAQLLLDLLAKIKAAL